MSQRTPPGFYTGAPVSGVSPSLLDAVESAVRAAGGTGVYVTSAKRPPGPGNDVKNSNHITGDALDGYAIVGGERVPVGQVILKVAGQFGLRSGDVPGFDPKTQGGFDPVHVDDGANVGGVKPFAPASSAPTTAPQTGSLAGLVAAQLARYPGLDPKAVLAVASQEGLGGGIGDGGHAFGPFQLNNAGGVITGKFAGETPEQIQQWATSPQGINYGLSGIAKVAGGLKGSQAVNAIVSRFERPANVPHEIAGALAAYGSQPMPAAVSPVASQLAGQPAAGAPGLAPAPTGPAKSALPLHLALQLLGIHPGSLK